MNKVKWALTMSAGIVSIVIGGVVFFSHLLALSLYTLNNVASTIVLLLIILMMLSSLGLIIAGSFACVRPKLKFGKYNNNLTVHIILFTCNTIQLTIYLIDKSLLSILFYGAAIGLGIAALLLKHPQNSLQTQYETIMTSPLTDEEKVRQERISTPTNLPGILNNNEHAAQISIETTRRLIALQKLLNEGTISQDEYNKLYHSYMNLK